MGVSKVLRTLGGNRPSAIFVCPRTSNFHTKTFKSKYFYEQLFRPTLMGIRKPSAILEASGAFGKNPNRRRPHEPRSNQPVGDPPAYLSPTEREIWAAIVFDCPAGVLTAADRWVLAMACQLQALAQARTIKGVERQQLIS